MNVKRILSIALAVVLCLGLAVPAMAAFPETWDEAEEKLSIESTLSDYENFVHAKYSLYEETKDYSKGWDNAELIETEESDGWIGYCVIPGDGEIVVKNTGTENDNYLTVYLRIYEKVRENKYIERYDYTRGYSLRKCDVFESVIISDTDMGEWDIKKLYAGESVTITAEQLLETLTRNSGYNENAEYLYRITLHQTYDSVGKYWYSSWTYVIDDAAAAKIKEKGIVNPFDDVSETDYFYDPVVWALKEEITTGLTEDLFGPKETCTRGQVATFLWRAKGCPEPETTENPFTDVSESDYYYKPILWAYENGITTGTTETTFSPNGTCTSAHVITFLWRANGEPEAKTDGTEYYAEAVAWATKNKLLEGTDMAFAPDNLSPRGDIVTYLYRDAK